MRPHPVLRMARRPMGCAARAGYSGGMHLVFAILAVLFVIAGFVGFIGGVFTIIFWSLAVLCVIVAWKLRPARVRRHEDRNLPPEPRS